MSYRFGSEIFRYSIGIITAETIHIGLHHPVFHGIYHGFSHVGIAEIQVGHILPVGASRVNNISRSILSIPAFVRNSGIVPCYVIGHPIEHNSHAFFVGFGGELA